MTNQWENGPSSPNGNEGRPKPENFRVPIEDDLNDDSYRTEGIIRRHHSEQLRHFSDSINSPLFNKIENKIFRKAVLITVAGSAISLVAILTGLTSINSFWLIPGALVSIAGIVWFRRIMNRVLAIRTARFERKVQKIAKETRQDLDIHG